MQQTWSLKTRDIVQKKRKQEVLPASWNPSVSENLLGAKNGESAQIFRTFLGG